MTDDTQKIQPVTDNVIPLGGGGIGSNEGDHVQRGAASGPESDEGFETGRGIPQPSVVPFYINAELAAVDGIAVLRVRHQDSEDSDDTAIISVPLRGSLHADSALGFLTYAQAVIDETIRAGEREQRAAQMQAMLQAQQQMQPGQKRIFVPE